MIRTNLSGKKCDCEKQTTVYLPVTQLVTRKYPFCTLNFGARERVGTEPTGQGIYLAFALTAGHCYPEIPHPVYRAARESGSEVRFEIGTARRSAYEKLVEGFETDALAIRLDGGWRPPSWIYVSSGVAQKVTGAATVYPGQIVCYSGAFYSENGYGGTHCGAVQPEAVDPGYDEGQAIWGM